MTTLRLGIDARGAQVGANVFTSATDKITNSASSVTSVVKKLAAVIGVSLSFGYAISEAMKAERAYYSLGASLDVVGAKTKQNMKIISDLAADIQSKTIYGDDELMNQAAYLKDLGVHTVKLKEATIAAVGLSAKYRLDLSTSMQLVGRASQGQTQMLTRYGIVLDETMTDQEKFNAILKLGADAFVLAEEAAETSWGKLQQLKNVIGDTAEIIGLAFLPELTKLFNEIKNYLSSNQMDIGKWAERSAAGLRFLIDVGQIFVEFMRNDFSSAVDFGLQISLSLFEAFGKDLTMLFQKIFTDLAMNIPVYIQRAVATVGVRAEIDKMIFNEVGKSSGIKKHLPGVIDTGGVPRGLTNEAIEERIKLIQTETDRRVAESMKELYAGQDMQSKFPIKEIISWDDVTSEFKHNHEEAVKSITQTVDTLPKLYKERLAHQYVKFGMSIDKINSRGTAVSKQEELNNTLTAGTKEYSRLSAAQVNTQKKIEDMFTTLEFERSLIGKTNDERERAVEMMKLQKVAQEAYGNETDKTVGVMERYRSKLMELQELRKLQTIADGIGDSFANAFERMVTGAASASDAIKSLAREVAALVLRQTVTGPLSESISSIFMGAFSGTSTASLGQSGTGGYHQYAVGGVFSRGISGYSNSVVDRPTIFPFARGVGLMGEAGPEAVMPLRRTSDGRLGVESSGKSNMSVEINVQNQSRQPVTATRGETKFDGDKLVTTIFIRDIASNGPMSQAMKAFNQR